jgi:hypothetical protein
MTPRSDESGSVEFRLGKLTGEVSGLIDVVGKLTTAVEKACTPASCPIGKEFSDFRSGWRGARLLLTLVVSLTALGLSVFAVLHG